MTDQAATDQAVDARERHAALRDALVDSQILRRSSVDGVYHRSAVLENIVRGIERLVGQARDGRYAPLRYFPPIMPRDDFVQTDYLRSFPDLIGSIETFVGSDADHTELLRLADSGGDWTTALTPAEVMLCSAACHPLYASVSGTVPPGGSRFEVQGFCFRHEPSIDPARMQSFRQHEFVFVGEPDNAESHRDEWLARGAEILSGLGLAVEVVLANDPFFGRAGRMLAANQKATALKFEIVAPVADEDNPTAITSANYHLDHFGVPFRIRTSDGETAHSACIGFGLERIALALLCRHGFDPASWPGDVRSQLQT